MQLLLAAFLAAAPPSVVPSFRLSDSTLRARVAEWRAVHEAEVFREYVELLRLPRTMTASAWGTSSLTASWRFWVA